MTENELREKILDEARLVVGVTKEEEPIFIFMVKDGEGDYMGVPYYLKEQIRKFVRLELESEHRIVKCQIMARELRALAKEIDGL